MSSLDIILPRFFLVIVNSIDIPQNATFVNTFVGVKQMAKQEKNKKDSKIRLELKILVILDYGGAEK